MSELISTILLLREEYINNFSLWHSQGNRDQDSRNIQLTTTVLDKLQLLPLPEKPSPKQAVMGSRPRLVTMADLQSKTLSEFS